MRELSVEVAFQSDTTGVSKQSMPRTPGLRRRLACMAYESVLLFGVIFFAALIYSVLTGQRHALNGRHGLGLVVFGLVPAAYFIGYWHKTGQTLPMQTWRIALETTDGQRLNLVRATLRFMATWIWIAPPLLMTTALGSDSLRAWIPAQLGWMVLYAMSSRLNRLGHFWHDLACGTRLIDLRPERAA